MEYISERERVVLEYLDMHQLPYYVYHHPEGGLLALFPSQ